MKTEEKLNFYIKQWEKPFKGWDFSFLTETDRIHSEPLPWSYGSTVLPFIRKSDSMLDMGTGGGELLSMLQPLPERTCATEGYPPNFPIAKSRLNPIGVNVYEVGEDNVLPFQDQQFDLILNKHESYSVEEVFRTLKPGGHFITQQVGGKDQTKLNDWFGEDPDFGYAYWELSYAKKELEGVGFKLHKTDEAFPLCRFYDVGAILFQLKATPWQVPNFSIQSHFEQLIAMEEVIHQNNYFETVEHRFMMIAQKPIK